MYGELRGHYLKHWQQNTPWYGASKTGGKHAKKTAFYHVHWYVYPLLYWMNLITNLACMLPESFDIAYLTELDPLWNDDEISMWLNPEVVLFANPLAQLACAADCMSTVTGTPHNSLFWCAGCQGGVYPLTGTFLFIKAVWMPAR